MKKHVLILVLRHSCHANQVPKGQTAFKFNALNFHSTQYDWLVVSGTNAIIQGSGTVNGSEVDEDGNPWKFMVWAGDNDPDTFRIKIWAETPALTEDILYDNGTDQPIDGGSIQIHKKKK